VTTQRSQISSSHLEQERGYVLLTLLLLVCLLAITAATLAPTIAFQIKRDREEELIHRGIQYRRAIHAFSKHTGRFPLTLDEMQNTSGAHYLRKQYKDPVTQREFKLLHANDIALSASGPNPLGAPASGADPDAPADPNAQPAEENSSAAGPPTTPGTPQGAGLPGGVILGVASSSSKKTIREFNHKNHYNQWLFFYSIGYDGSVEVKGPTPQTPVFANPNTPPTPTNSPGSAPPPQSPQSPQAPQAVQPPQ